VKTPTAATAVATAAPPAPVAPVVPAVAEAPLAPVVILSSLTAITHERVDGAVRITLQVDRETSFHSDSLVGPPRVFVDLKNTRMLERLRDAVIPVTDPVVQRIRVGRQPGNLTRVVLDLAQGHRYSAYSMYDPYRVVIDVEAPEAKATAAVETLTPVAAPEAAPKTAAAPVVVPAVAMVPKPETKTVAKAVTPRTAAAVTPPAATAAPAAPAPAPTPQAAPQAPIVIAAADVAPAAATPAIALVHTRTVDTTADRTPDTVSAPAADVDPVDDAPPLAPGIAASIAAAVALAAPSAPPPFSPSPLVAIRTTVTEGRMQATSTPRRLQAGDTTAAVNALIATRPAATAADDAAATADASIGTRQAPATDAPAAGDGPAVVAPGSASKTARGDYSLSRQLGLGVARVVIDAGHGGHDPGAKVKGGLTEAGLVLDIAQRLELLLRKQPGVDVIMTRRSDTSVALEERTVMANRAGADLFVSIHANASANPRARGVETYVLNFATSPEAESIAARENSASSRTMRNLPEIVKTIATNNKLDESRELARFVQTSLHSQLRKGDSSLRNLGVKQAPFMVLIGATMPAILTEVAFVTNQDDASHLKNEKYRQDVAEALLGGITRYQQSLKRTAPAVAAQQTP
jgi:N-acetylmuramoyl-L-alanine amidase